MLVEALQYFKTQCYLGMISEYFTYNIYKSAILLQIYFQTSYTEA